MVDWYGRWHYESNTPDKKKCDITLSDTASEALFEKITHY